MIHDHMRKQASYIDASKFKCHSFRVPLSFEMTHISRTACSLVFFQCVHILRRRIFCCAVVDKIKGVRACVRVWFLMEVIQNKQKIGILLRSPIPIPFTVVIGCGRQSYWMPSNKWLMWEQYSFALSVFFDWILENTLTTINNSFAVIALCRRWVRAFNVYLFFLCVCVWVGIYIRVCAFVFLLRV